MIKILKTLLNKRSPEHQKTPADQEAPADQKTPAQIPQALRSQRGNVFVMVFGAIAAVGVLGVTTMDLIKGPMRTAVQATNRSATENSMMTGMSLILTTSAAPPSGGDADCDGDTFVEPLPYRSATPSPVGGGQIPSDVGATKVDSWGTPYGYCTWDHSTFDTTAGACPDSSTERLQGVIDSADVGKAPAVALISAGPNRTFETTCRTFQDADATGIDDDRLDPGELMIVESSGSDDIVYSRTYDEGVSGSGGLWEIKTGSPDTVVVDNKNIETEGKATFGAAGSSFDDTDQTGVLFANQGIVVGTYDLSCDVVTNPGCRPRCTGTTNDGLIVRDSNDNDQLKICGDPDGDGTTEWTTLGGGGGGGGGITCADGNPPDDGDTIVYDNALGAWTCTPQGASGNSPPFFAYGETLTITLEVDQTMDISSFLAATDLNTKDNLTWSAQVSPADVGSNNGTLSGLPAGPVQASGFEVKPAPGTVTYTAPSSDSEDDSFTIRVEDDKGAFNDIAVTVNIDTNEPPVFTAGDFDISLDQDTSTSINADLAADDVETGGTLTWTLNTAPSNGNIENSGGAVLAGNEIYSGATDAGGSLTPTGLLYIPNSGYAGSDSFNVKLSDGSNEIFQNFSVTVRALSYKVFVTENDYSTITDFSSLANADSICQTEATSAGLSGTYKAWLSNQTIDAKDRITDKGPYKLPNDTLVASDIPDLTDSSLDSPINRTASNVTRSGVKVWTHTRPNGTTQNGTGQQGCDNYTIDVPYRRTRGGDSGETSNQWSDRYALYCNRAHAFYCIEQ